MTTISIAMATYNGASFIQEQLESFASQTVLPTELVVTDDQSTDGTLDIITKFAASAPFPVRIERNDKTLGYRSNFMKAAGMCKSDLIAFSDQDDIWLPNKLEACLTPFSRNDVLLVYHNATVVTQELEPVDTISGRGAPQTVNPPLSIGPWNFGPGFTQVFRSSLKQFDDLWPESVDFHDFNAHDAHDKWYFFWATSLGTVVYLQEQLVLYRRHGNTATKWMVSSRFKKILFNLIYTNIRGIKSLELSAGARVKLLEKASSRLNGQELTLARLAMETYRKLEKRFRGRCELYVAGTFKSRLRRLIALMRNGEYLAKSSGGAGPKAFVRDLFVVFFPARYE